MTEKTNIKIDNTNYVKALNAVEEIDNEAILFKRLIWCILTQYKHSLIIKRDIIEKSTDDISFELTRYKNGSIGLKAE
jgi:hypothetical protein